MLRQLGTPAAWENDASPAEVLAPLVRAAAETARRMAMAEPDDASAPPASPPSTKTGRTRSRPLRRGAAARPRT